jgi:D-alanyl-D-alanine carboxypeptidase
VWAKTGSINYADTLAGFLLSPSHGPAVFAIMIADFEARSAYDALSRRTRSSESAAASWHQESRAIIDQIVRGWLLPEPSTLPAGEPGQA